MSDKSDLYEILSIPSENERLKYTLVVISIAIALVRYLSPYLNIAHGITITLVTTILPILYSSWKNETGNFLKDMDFKLSTIDPDDELNFLYMDANMVNLLYSIYDFKSFAPEVYERLLVICNNFLRLRSDFDTGLLADMSEQYYSADILANKAINQFHSFIYSVNNPTIYKLYNTAFQRFRIIVRRQLDVMRTIALSKSDKNGLMPFIPTPEQPKALAYELFESDADRAYNIVI